MYVSAWPGLTFRDVFGMRKRRRTPFPLDAENQNMFHVARSGIYHLFRALAFTPGETVLVPDYHSGNELAAIHAAGAGVTLYPIRRNFEPDLDVLADLARKLKPRAIYIIHYLGWPQPMKEIQALCAEYGSILIEDCALSLLSSFGQRPLGTFGDYSIFCLYKTLPVPNGGVLVQNRQPLTKLERLRLNPCPRAAAAGRSAELALEALRSRFDSPGKALFNLKRAIGRRIRSSGVKHVPVGDIGWDIRNVNIAMSPLSSRVMCHQDYDHIREKRRANFILLKRLTAGRVSMPREDVPDCPLFFPVLVRDKHDAAEALRQSGIEAVEFWNGSQNHLTIGPDASFLRAHVLELPIHQGVSTAQIEFIADRFLQLNPEPAC